MLSHGAFVEGRKADKGREGATLLPLPQRGFYLPELDAMRFFAFLCIFFHHTFSQSRIGAIASHESVRSIVAESSKFAVSLFFLLSGYLISVLLVLELEITGGLHLGDFYRRRVARIWPLYYSFIAIVLLAGLVISRVQPSRGALLAFVFLSGNWFIADVGGMAGGLGILWSVNIEGQFYLLWPLLLKWGRGLRLISVVILLCSYVVLLWFGMHGKNSDLTLRFNTFVEMQFFSMGALLAGWLPRAGLQIPLVFRLLLIPLGGCCWIAGVCLSHGRYAQSVSARYEGIFLYGCVLVGCVLVFLGFHGAPVRWFPRPILWLGKISYGLYVYHSLVLALMPRWWPGIGWATIRCGVEFLLTVIVAGASYRWLEQPFLRWKKNVTFVPNRPV